MKLPTVYFYLPENDDVYFDAPLVLAEGLKELGVTFYANRDYWQLDPESKATLFRKTADLSHEDADIVIIHDDWFYHFPQSTLRLTMRPAPPGLFRPRKQYRLVYLDTWVGVETNSWRPEFRSCDLILRTQFNNRSAYPSNMQPWVLGFTQRVLAAASAGALPFSQRQPTILENFSYSHPYPHGLRRIFADRIAPRLQRTLSIDRTKSQPDDSTMLPYDRLMWRQTVDKHNRDYFNRLGSAMTVAAFCGSLCPSLPRGAAVHYRGGRRARILAMGYQYLSTLARGTPRAIQWDSWRLWESFCAGAVPMHLDLEKYGAALPVMPTNWQHYLGVDLDRVDDFIDRLEADFTSLGRIAAEGHRWAVANYAPQMMAARLLAACGYTGIPAAKSAGVPPRANS